MKKTLLFLIFFLTTFTFSAQNPTDVTYKFGSRPGFSSSVKTVLIQPNGKILVGGEFVGYQGGETSSSLYRLNNDGSLDDSFNVGNDFGYIYSVVLQPDGKILVAGNFINYKGTTQNRLIRLNSDGSKDTTFDIGTGFNEGVQAIALQEDGKIIVGGFFNKFKEITQNRLIRLNTDGSKDESFDIGSGFDSYVTSIVVQTNGKILVGGEFYKYKGSIHPGLLRLNTDGTRDITFSVENRGFNNNGVTSVVIQPDNKLLVGGYFNTYKGIDQNHLIRLNTDGTKDTTFDIGTGFNNNVNSITLQSDGKILVGGDFTSFKGTIQNHFMRLNSDGSADESLAIGTGFNDAILTAKEIDGNLILGGRFDAFQGINQNYLVGLKNDGTKNRSFSIGTGLNYYVRCMHKQSDEKILIGGDFITYKESLQNHIMRLNPDGNKDNTFEIGDGFDGPVESILQQPDGKIVVGGSFKTYNGISQKSLIRLNSDGSKDNTFEIGNGFDNPIKSLALQSDGKIIAGGFFSTYQGIPQKCLIRLNGDGSKDTTFDVGNAFNNGSVEALSIQEDGKIIVGGSFTTYRGNSQKGLVRLNPDGNKDTSFDIKSGFNSGVQVIALQPDGKIFVGGDFYIFQGYGQFHLVRLNTNGSMDSTFNIGSGVLGTGFSSGIQSIAIQPNGQLIVGGFFTSYNGVTQNHLSRLNSDGSRDTTFNIGDGFNNPVYSVLLQNDGQIMVGGNFTTYQGDNKSAYLIRLQGTYIATPIVPTITPTHVTCAGSNGAATVAVYGGKAPYTYLWSNGAKTAEITGLAAGNYSCTVTDADLATITENFNITTIADTQNPSITAPLNISVNANSGCEATGVVLGNPITADNCTVVSLTNDAPIAFPIGNTTVTWTVKDASDNIATATQIVTVKGLDVKVTNNAGILMAAETEATYKWFECNNGLFVEIPNENKISFTPVKVGSYAVEVTKNGCSAKSTCYDVKTLGTKDFDLENSLKLYPNPSKDFVTIEINSADNTKLKIFDINGHSVFSKELKDGSNTINISHLSIGVYMFEISNETGKTIKKVIKK